MTETLDMGISRRGRPPGTSAKALAEIALRLFTAQGFDETTVEQIATEAGVSARTFFRYFSSKGGVLWNDFDIAVGDIRRYLAEAPPDAPIMDAVRTAVVRANRYHPEDVPGLRARMDLIGSVPALFASAAVRYDAWEGAVAEYVALRTGQPAASLYPLAVARASLAVCRAAYDRWVARPDAELTVHLDAAFTALAGGFADDVLTSEP
jgi:mycofactocin system transcriptional regulator